MRAHRKVHANLLPPALVAESLRRHDGQLSEDGALMVKTGEHTGRSMKDKFVVDEPSVSKDIWWGEINQRLSQDKFEVLKSRVQAYLQGQELFTQDLYAGADPAYRVRVRLVTTQAWNALFARNMFIRPDVADLASFAPNFTVYHAPEFQADTARHGTRTGTFIVLNLAAREILIGGTRYAGEIKKSVFSFLNWWLPSRGVMPMHCSANVSKDGKESALFFGLSGTGKTTLSADPRASMTVRRTNPGPSGE